MSLSGNTFYVAEGNSFNLNIFATIHAEYRLDPVEVRRQTAPRLIIKNTGLSIIPLINTGHVKPFSCPGHANIEQSLLLLNPSEESKPDHGIHHEALTMHPPLRIEIIYSYMIVAIDKYLFLLIISVKFMSEPHKKYNRKLQSLTLVNTHYGHFIVTCCIVSGLRKINIMNSTFIDISQEVEKSAEAALLELIGLLHQH